MTWGSGRTRSLWFSSCRGSSPGEPLGQLFVLIFLLEETRNASACLLARAWILGSLIEQLGISQGVRSGGGDLSRQMMLALRRCWPALFSEPGVGILVPMLRAQSFHAHPLLLLLSLFSPFHPSLSQHLFFHSLLSSLVELKAGGPRSFSFLAVYHVRKPCCL